MLTTHIVKTIRICIGSPKKIRLKIAANIGIEAKINTALATLVWVRAITKAGAVVAIKTV